MRGERAIVLTLFPTYLFTDAVCSRIFQNVRSPARLANSDVFPFLRISRLTRPNLSGTRRLESPRQVQARQVRSRYRAKIVAGFLAPAYGKRYLFARHRYSARRLGARRLAAIIRVRYRPPRPAARVLDESQNWKGNRRTATEV